MRRQTPKGDEVKAAVSAYPSSVGIMSLSKLVRCIYDGEYAAYKL
jgi:hypothetical protein